MKYLVPILLLALLAFLIIGSHSQQQPNQSGRPRVKVPRELPVYIDPPQAYFNEPIIYEGWNPEISSSL
jgi:hypothetical protein